MFFYDNFLKKLDEISKYCSIQSFGKSVLNRELFAVYIGKGNKKLIVQYSIHAREYICTHLCFLHIKSLLKKTFDGQIILVPMSNPDGVSLCVDGLDSVKSNQIKSFLQNINKSNNFSLWKANANAVDLNVNFDANWGNGKHNAFTPSSENFIGYYPADQPETQALCNLVEKEKPIGTISYHSKGEEIYFKFKQKRSDLIRDQKIANEISKLTTYKIKNTPFSVGGFKDWCIQKYNIPSFTIEVGKDEFNHPINIKNLPYIWSQNRLVPEKTLALCSGFDI